MESVLNGTCTRTVGRGVGGLERPANLGRPCTDRQPTDLFDTSV